MKRNTVVGLVGVVVLIVGVVTYTAVGPSPAKTPADVSGGSYEEHSQYFDIDATYATSTPLQEAAGRKTNTAAVALMKKFVDETIAQFKTDGNFSNLSPKDIEMLGDQKQDLQLTYFTSSSTRAVSYIFNIYAYTLGAHGNTNYKTFTFDLKNGSLLTLKDIFVPNAPYLSALSAASRRELPKLLSEYAGTDMLEAGTTPEEKNFETFFLDGTSLVILFPPYAVAPYAAGPQTLAIPVSELKAILKPEYQ